MQKVYCGHEYTVANLKFAKHVEPDNQDILQKITWATERRANQEPTVPSTIGEQNTHTIAMKSRILYC